MPLADDPHQWVRVDSDPWDRSAPMMDWGDAGRWIGAFQRDLASRLRWSVTPAAPRRTTHRSSRWTGRPTAVPGSAAPGQTLDVVIEATDDGDVSLTSYARVVKAVA